MGTTRWGIVSAGKISNDFTLCLLNMPKEEHVVGAVGARSLESAKAFANKFGIPKAYGSYDELFEDKDIDVFYIGAMHSNHYALALKLLNGGRNVVCEKPLCLNVRQTKSLVEAARRKNVFFMEGLWSRFFPVYGELKKQLKECTIGKPIALTCTFGVKLGFERLQDPKLGGSVTLELGCYLVQLALLVFGEKPIKVVASGHLYESGTDELSSFILLFKNGGVANLMCSWSVDMKNVARIFGTEGSIEFEIFHAPTEITTPSGKKIFKLPQFDTKPIYINSEGFCYEAQGVREALLKGQKEHECITLDDSIHIAEVLEEILNQIGVTSYKNC